MPSARNRPVPFVTWSVVLFLLIAACGSGGDPAASGSGGPGAMPVKVGSPQMRTVTLWDNYIGRFEATERVELRPRVSGYLENIHFKEGAYVAEGDLLFTIDQRPFEAALDQANANLAQVRTNARLAQAELARAKELFDARAGSQEEYERALQARDAARANSSGAEASVRQAELDLGYTRITAPISGRIGQRRIDKGNLVTAGQTLLTTIVSVDPIHFTFTGTEGDYLNYVRLDQAGDRTSSRDAPNPIRIKIEGEDDFTIDGRMDFVDNEIDSRTGTIVGRALVPNDAGILTPGMFGEARLYGRDPFDAMVVPDTIVQFDQARQFVWVIGEEGTATMRFVRLGRLLDDDMRIVDEGLILEDRLIVSGFTNLRPGMPVVDAATLGEKGQASEDKPSGSPEASAPDEPLGAPGNG